MQNSSNALYSVAAIRRIEQAALSALPSGSLMQKAGAAAAKFAQELLPSPLEQRKVVVLAGPGNNGGDAFVAADCLSQAGLALTVFFDADPEKLSADARAAYEHARKQPIRWEHFSALPAILAEGCDLAIDGLFGIGLRKAIASPYREAVQAVNRLSCPIIALDIPSGLDADTGTVAGDDGIAVIATHTITFIAGKPGLHTAYGRDHAGSVRVEDLDIDARFFEAPQILRNDPALFCHRLERRAHNSHKGSYGNVAIIGGARGMHGAAILAGRSALHLGAGRVYVGFLDDAPAYDGMQPELMCRCANDTDIGGATLIAGPGLGSSQEALALLTKVASSAGPLVLDADALNLVAAHPELQQAIARRSAAALLTPHPLEAARLLATSAAAIQADRLHAAGELARRLNAVVVLKGSGTVLARPDGNFAINITGNPALATAGTGDVLAGMCGALLAQNYGAWEAALAAVWIHGLAADRLVAQGVGPVGLSAGELIPAAREVLNRLIDGTLEGV